MLRGMPLLSMAVTLLATLGVCAGETKVSVHLASGRELTGVLDSRTDDAKLWLRWAAGNVELQRPIAWEQIKSVDLDGVSIEVQKLQEQAAKLATPGRTTQLRPASLETPPRSSLATLRAVQSIRCDAWLANWDADAEFDGLILQVVSLDQFGNAVTAQGTIDADLTTIDYQPAYLNSSSGGRVPTSLGHWSQRWDSHGQNRLDLLGQDPQRDRKLDRYAVLKVRVTIPGSGVFEQQIDGVRTRPFSPIQNALWR